MCAEFRSTPVPQGVVYHYGVFGEDETFQVGAQVALHVDGEKRLLHARVR